MSMNGSSRRTPFLMIRTMPGFCHTKIRLPGPGAKASPTGVNASSVAIVSAANPASVNVSATAAWTAPSTSSSATAATAAGWSMTRWCLAIPPADQLRQDAPDLCDAVARAVDVRVELGGGQHEQRVVQQRALRQPRGVVHRPHRLHEGGPVHVGLEHAARAERREHGGQLAERAADERVAVHRELRVLARDVADEVDEVDPADVLAADQVRRLHDA